jgi:hypothetical protein
MIIAGLNCLFFVHPLSKLSIFCPVLPPTAQWRGHTRHCHSRYTGNRGRTSCHHGPAAGCQPARSHGSYAAWLRGCGLLPLCDTLVLMRHRAFACVGIDSHAPADHLVSTAAAARVEEDKEEAAAAASLDASAWGVGWSSAHLDRFTAVAQQQLPKTVRRPSIHEGSDTTPAVTAPRLVSDAPLVFLHPCFRATIGRHRLSRHTV